MKKLIKRGTMMIVTFVTIILIIIMGITIGGRAKVTMPENIIGKVIVPVQKVLYKGGQGIERAVSSLFTFRTIAKENEVLKKEIEKLNQKVIQLSLTRDELNELRSLYSALNYAKENNKNNYVTASITGKDIGNWFNMFTIDAGKNQGIKKNSTVMNGQGLIGKVFEVGDDWSKVVTIIDNKSSVSFQVLRNNQYIGVIRGSVKGELNGYLIDPEADVLVGDKLITSGLSMYEKGILIGEIKEVIKKEDELLKTIVVEPVVNFKKLDKVFIIVPDKLN
ncbi:rod shape-determining protein MreC [Crassaminicella indica]|uniref:Cell shape-determining protein MreC n=2 Tax=Crassaminicella indica TaxID=2855394 RepID=A0ABX8RAD2_9CLOT|nr:rod shape-determining protein MreC [Crassaminicella indica]